MRPIRFFVLLVAAAGLLTAAGCSNKPPPSPASSNSIGGGQYEWHSFKELKPEAGLDEAQASFGTWGNAASGSGLAFVILSDVVGPSKVETKSSGKISGQQRSTDGRQVDWQCDTSDGKTGTVTLNGQVYDLAQGSLFLVSTKGTEARMLQLKRDTMKLKVGNDPKVTLESLIKGDEEIGPFFANAGKPK